MKRSLAVFLSTLYFGTAQAATFEVGGDLSYDTLTSFGLDDDFTGPSLTGRLASSIYSLTSGTDLTLGANLSYQNVSTEYNGTDYKIQNLSVGGFVGLDIAASQRFHLQTNLGYDVGLSGEVERKPSLGNKVTNDIDKLRRLHYEVMGVLHGVLPANLGLGVRWFQGYLKEDDVMGELNFRGFQLVASVMFPL